MKKLTIFILIMTLLCSLSLNCAAAEEALSLSNVNAQPGETVYMTVTLNESVVANTIGITYDYDSSLLEALPSSCSWVPKGVLQDFDKNGSGVWTTQTAGDLKGALCVLAFRVLPEAAFTQTTVSCTVLLKDGSSETGRFTAEAVISQNCSHSYGDWTSLGIMGHSRSCSICKASLTESHSWDAGVLSQKKDEPNTNLMTYTCTVCGGTNVIEIPAGTGQPKPTEPVDTEPTWPTKPAETQPTYPTKPAETQPTYPTAPRETEPSREENVHTGNQGNTGNQSNTSNQGNPGNQGSNGSQSGGETGGGSYRDYNSTGSGTNEDSKPNVEATTSKPYRDYNSDDPQTANPDGETGAEDHSGHDHESSDERVNGTSPMVVPAVPDDATAETIDHDHDHAIEYEQQGNPAVNAVILLGLLAAAIGAALYYVKKKH